MENSKMGENAADNVEITFYTAECMEFVRYGEYREGLGTLEEALKYYDEIPPDRLNAVKGIGIHVYDPKENGFIQEFPLIMGKTMDLDLLWDIHGISRYPQILEIAKSLAKQREDITVVDSHGILKETEITIGASELAKRINDLQRKIDPDFYSQFYPDEEKQEKKVMMKLLTEDGRKEYLSWLKAGHMVLQNEVRAEAEDISQLLEHAQIQWPEIMPPFVFICWSETYELEDGDVIPLEEADPIFERLDRTRVKENKENDTGGYDKTKFVIYYQINGEPSTYEGRQDFGDGDGSLIEHIEGFAKYYLETESGRQFLKDMGEERGRAMQEDCEYIRDELLPYLKYHCNLYGIEKALLEEQKAEEKIPVVTDRQEARKEYQKDMLAFIQESRRVLNQGGTLPVMPDIRDYEETKEKRAYREHVMKEIAEEAKGYGMTVEEYAKNGYEPKKR